MNEPSQTMALVLVRVKEIVLTQGKVAIVDVRDFDWLSQWKWQAKESLNTFYAVRNVNKLPAGSPRRMHRLIMNAMPWVDVDHWDGNGLNNTRRNLRFATESQNLANRGKQRDNTSGYKGSFFVKSTGRWRAQIKLNRKPIHLGYFDTAIEAAYVYDVAALRHHGEFAVTNFKDSKDSISPSAKAHASVVDASPLAGAAAA